MTSIFKVHETYQELKRYGRIVSILARYGFGDLLRRLKVRHLPWQRMLTKEARAAESLSAPERVRLAFEELGPTFIKFGQALSSRPDLLPTEFVKELSKLQDSVPPFPFGDAKALIEAQFGRPLVDVFDSFEEKPLAAAFLAQIHRARTKAGDEVAVKVQRPGIEDTIETDIRILHGLAALWEMHLPGSRYYKPVQIVDEFAKTIRQELDFVREGQNIQRFGKFFADDETVYIPKAYWDLTTPKVLTMEYICGIKVSELEQPIEYMHGMRISELEQLRAIVIDRQTIALNVAEFILKEVFQFHCFLADPHPGNIFILENNVIAPVDFGMVGMLDEEIVHQLGVLFRAIVKKDADMLANFFLSVSLVPEPLNRGAFRAELTDFLERCYELPLRQLIIKSILDDLMGLARRYRLRLPPELGMMAKALVMNQDVGTMLYPGFNFFSLGQIPHHLR